MSFVPMLTKEGATSDEIKYALMALGCTSTSSQYAQASRYSNDGTLFTFSGESGNIDYTLNTTYHMYVTGNKAGKYRMISILNGRGMSATNTANYIRYQIDGGSWTSWNFNQKLTVSVQSSIMMDIYFKRVGSGGGGWGTFIGALQYLGDYE